MTAPAGGTVLTEPMFIGGHQVYVKFYALARNPGDPSRIEGTFTLVGGEGVLTLDALVGPQGNPGQPSPIIRPQWDQLGVVTDAEDLPNTATLDESDDGRAWYIDGSWHVYSDADGDFHVVQGSIPGPPGATPVITISAEQVEAESPDTYGPIEIIPSGTSLLKNYHFKIPGVPGPEGPAASIESASDYDDEISAQNGDFLVFNGETEKWAPGNPNLLYPKIWTIPQANFIDYNGNAGRQLIATLNIPAQDYEWYPEVNGHVRIRREWLSSAQVEVEVRIGDTGMGTGESQPLCGLAPYDPALALLDQVTIAHILPHFSNGDDELRAISPDSSVARVPEGQAKTIYVFVRKAGGTGNYSFSKTGAHLWVKVNPVV